MRRALLAAALLCACGIKAAPRPPVKPGAAPEERPAAAEPSSCVTCGAASTPSPSPRIP